MSPGMKTLHQLAATIFLLAVLTSCTSVPKTIDSPQLTEAIDWKPDLSLSLHHAEQILGESAHLEDASAYLVGNTKTYESTYLADVLDDATGKTGAMYFMYEEYETLQAASLSYESIRSANERAPGVESLFGVGDEAYFHSDGTNFLFVLSRSENKLFRIKVSKTTSHTNKDALIDIANAFWK
jgi:hypothetical protein